MTEMTMRMIPIGEIAESPSNPRKRFDDLEELAESLREAGMLEPLLVRPRPTDPRPPGVFWPYELVCGARRLRAARMAGMAIVPAMLRELDDAQVLELQLIENNQRQDVTPMEEASAFAALVRLGRAPEDVASRIGRSVGYVRARLRLLELVPEVRALLEAGRIHVGSALLLAQVHEKQQREIAERITKGVYRPRKAVDDPWSSADVSSLLRDTARRVSLAVWPLDDEDLVPSAGPCTTCPRRSGSQRALLAEMEGEDQCLDDECWSTKSRATVDAARTRGELVLEGALLDRAYDAGSFFEMETEVDEEDFADASAGVSVSETWGEALRRIGQEPAEWTLAAHPGGEVTRMISAAHLADLVEAHWPETARVLRLRWRTWNERAEREDARRLAPAAMGAASTLDDDEDHENSEADAQREEARQRAIRERRAHTMAAHDLAVAVVGAAWSPSEDVWRALARVATAGASIMAVSWVAERRGLGDIRGIDTWCLTATEAELRGLVFELAAYPALASIRLFEPGTGPAAENGPYGIDRLFDAIGVEAGRALNLARKRIADEERAAERAAKKAANKETKKKVANAKKAREVRDGA